MKHLIKYSGIALALGIDGWLIYDNFITLDVNSGLKIGFIGLMALFVIFIIVWRYLQKFIDRKLQAIETAKELNVIGKTSLWWTTILEWIGIVVPLLIVGGLFYFVGNYFNQIGQTILTMTSILVIPFVATIVYKIIERNEMINADQLKQEKFVKSVAEEVKKVTYK